MLKNVSAFLDLKSWLIDFLIKGFDFNKEINNLAPLFHKFL